MIEEPIDSSLRTLSDILHEYIVKQAEHMDQICLMALILGCGVRLTYHEDGGYTVSVDEDVPPYTIYEYKCAVNLGLHDYP